MSGFSEIPVFISVACDTAVDIEAFAKWIQSIAESGVVDDLNAHLLIIKSVVVDPPVVNVAGGFSVKGVLDEGNNLDETQY
ncbi:MAG: hypothetical protein GY799_29715, partial [Desulfobulbaceae bacterium]|nr:hypothetical protein [Desulfobulbaceae bacterium]